MSKELTDAWKAGKLKALRLYYVLYKNGHIGKANLIQTPDFYGFWNNCNLNDLIKEVLALVPEYTEFVHLETKAEWQAKRIKELEQDVKTLTNNYKLLEKQQVKECKNIVAHDCWQEAQFPDGQVVERQDFLTRLNAAIGESEE